MNHERATCPFPPAPGWPTLDAHAGAGSETRRAVSDRRASPASLAASDPSSPSSRQPASAPFLRPGYGRYRAARLMDRLPARSKPRIKARHDVSDAALAEGCRRITQKDIDESWRGSIESELDREFSCCWVTAGFKLRDSRRVRRGPQDMAHLRGLRERMKVGRRRRISR